MQIETVDILALMENLETTKSCAGFTVKYQHGKIKHVQMDDTAIMQEEMRRLMRPR